MKNNFDEKKVTEEIIAFIKDYYDRNQLKGAVLGISGGKDSATVAGLFCKALGPENVIGVTLPCHSKDKDKTDAKIVSEAFGFKLYDLDLTKVFDTFKESFYEGFKDLTPNEFLKDSDINLKPRLRMASVYYIAQFFSTYMKKGYLVAGTSNLCELHVGYFTKGGDNVHDISVLGDLTVKEVIKVGDYIGVPHEVLYKIPSDGLSDLSDEDKLGVTYDDIAKVIYNEEVDMQILEQINKLHDNSRHKFNIPTYKKSEEGSK